MKHIGDINNFCINYCPHVYCEKQCITREFYKHENKEIIKPYSLVISTTKDSAKSIIVEKLQGLYIGKELYEVDNQLLHPVGMNPYIRGYRPLNIYLDKNLSVEFLFNEILPLVNNNLEKIFIV